MIEIDDVTFGYPEAERPVLRGVSLRVEEGELVLVSGRTGTGKSTLLGLVNGLVPQFTGGRLSGDVRIHGRSIRGTPPRELAHLVGYVGQDPLAGFVTDTVEEELAYGMEQLGLPPATMRRRVEETLDLLGIADLRTRDLASLSGGQQQRVALGSVLTMHPRVLVLDEPTSALDPTAAEEVLATLTRLVHDAGLSVVVAEHRLERVLPFADRVVRLVGDGTVVTGSPGEVVADGVAVPPLVELGRWAGWSPLPLSVRDARRAAGALRSALPAPGPGVMPASRPLAEVDDVSLMRDQTLALRSVSVSLGSGLVTAVMGRNGSGKSSLFWTIQGSLSRTAGRVRVEGEDPASASASRRRALVGLVPQTAADLLYLETVAEECSAADSAAGAAPGHTRELLASLVPGIPPEAHPRDLSEGQRLALALAVVLSTRPRVLLLDEPTRGLDYPGKSALARVLRGLAAEGRAVAVATHDVEFVAEAADQVVVLADGEVISAGPVAEVVAQSPAFAPQVSKVLGPGWLTVAQVAAAVEDSAASGEGS